MEICTNSPCKYVFSESLKEKMSSLFAAYIMMKYLTFLRARDGLIIFFFDIISINSLIVKFLRDVQSSGTGPKGITAGHRPVVDNGRQ